jgi:hypothetical protein
MDRYYARFSSNHPWMHLSFLAIVAAIFCISCYQLLVNEELIFAVGLAVPVVIIPFFAMAANYKRKYMHD